ncbi:hypothetical protein [Streptomyces melanogenes]|uniref:hypothetical protein n=1 Tax=Streptomyces melanogenes TaxID=67326 RepID=UPI00379EEA90
MTLVEVEALAARRRTEDDSTALHEPWPSPLLLTTSMSDLWLKTTAFATVTEQSTP